MATSSSYSGVAISLLGFLALFSIILGSIASSLAVRAWNGNGYTGKAASALLAFDGFFTFLWAIIVIIVLVCVDDVSKGFAKWFVGPISLMFQVFLIWALFLAGSAALSARHDNFRCSWSGAFWRTCSSLYNSTLAFGWMSWILLTILLVVLPYFIISGYGDDGRSDAGQERYAEANLENQPQVKKQKKMKINKKESSMVDAKAQEAYPNSVPATQN